MLDKIGFDLWADGYDKTVGLSDDENSYPFAGYREVLAKIYEIVLSKEQPTVLDIGFGTGTLTTRLYEKGCKIYGQDFSTRMIELAQKKMPGASLFQGDFSKGLVKPLVQNSYDFIIATYSLHHLTDVSKIKFIQSATDFLNENGAILIGDVAFETRTDLENCRQESGDDWDEDEIYFVFDEISEFIPRLKFEQVSYCAGLLSLEK